MDDAQRKAREEAERLRKKIKREEEEQQDRIKAPPVFPPSKKK